MRRSWLGVCEGVAGGGTGVCLLFKVHQEAPGDPDQVQPPAPPPAPFGSLNLACRGLVSHLAPLGGLLCPHGHARAPVHRWLPPRPPAGSSRPCFCPLAPSDSGARGDRDTVEEGHPERSLPPPVGSVPGASRRTWSFFSGYFIVRPLPGGWKSPALSSLLVRVRGQ